MTPITEFVNPQTGNDIHSSPFPDSPDPSFPVTWGIGRERRIADGVAVVIPAYNNELIIASMILKIRMHIHHVVVVDYGSEDLTAELARAAGADVIALPGCTEKSVLLMQGIHRAEEADCPAVLMIDAEDRFSPGDLLRVAAPVFNGEADLVIGTPARGTRASHAGAVMHAPGLLNALRFMNEEDAKSPEIIAFNRKTAGSLDFKPNGSDFWKNAVFHVARRDLTVRTIDLPEPSRTENPGRELPPGESSDGIFRDFRELGARNPLILFSVLGCMVLLAGAAGGYLTVEEYTNTARIHGLLAFASMIAMLAGLLLINSGLMLNSLMKTARKPD